jgi:cobalt-zinc-cadmium efflux system membrane fusion protein
LANPGDALPSDPSCSRAPRPIHAGFAPLFAALAIGACAIAPTEAAAQTVSRRDQSVRVGADQMHQLRIVRVELYPFRSQKFAIGQIAYNEDTATVVLTPFPGRVTRLIAKVGDKVKRGDPLFEIDSPDVVQPQNDFIAAVSAVNKARSQLELALINEKRKLDLFQGKAGPLKEWQQAEDQLVTARNDMRSAETTLDAMRNRLRIIGRTDEEIDALQERGAISRTIAIRAPIDGTVVGRKVGPGQYVRTDPGESLYSIADLSTMWLKAYVTDTDISSVRVGQEVEVKVIALPDRALKARIALIGAASDVSTRRILVRAEIPNPDGALKGEMFASFRIGVGPDQPTPAVPVEAVIREGELATVWVEQEPMLFRRRKVQIGMEQDDRVQIRSGLEAGEQVIARGAIFVENEWKQ